jgi:ariadne-1
MFYFTRFDNHDKSIRFAQETRKKAEVVMGRLQDKLGTSYQDVQFVLQAVNAVIECRRVLKWSYVFGYYLDSELEKVIFENHQERLEKFTEALHGLSEKPLEDLLETSVRTQIVNYTRVVERYRDNVLIAIENGLKI